MTIDTLLLGFGLLLLFSILASRISDRFGIPTLLVFLAIGMLAGSEGLGGIYFDDPALAQSIGVAALVLILFSGGLDTDFESIRPVFRQGLALSTLGVLLTAGVVGLAAWWLLDFSLLEGLLLGAIVSSTDAAAVFSVLRSRGLALKGSLKPLLELESGSNDPMAIFLTTGLIALLSGKTASPLDLLASFVVQMLLGGLTGGVMGWLMQRIINRARLGYEGLYPVLTLALAFFTFGLTQLIGGNGFLAVYLAGIFLNRGAFLHRRSLVRFHDGLAWLMQIAMFLTLGLLVFPSRLPPVAGVSLLIAAALIFLARPVSVFLSLAPTRLTWREKTFIAWVGLRGAVPIILATYPLLAGIDQNGWYFNVVFFVVLTSVLLQGTTLPLAARLLGVDLPAAPRRPFPIEADASSGFKSELKELPVPPGSPAVGRAILELNLPANFLIVLIARGQDFIITNGGTIIEEGDVLLALSDAADFQAAREIFQPGRD